jgi:hypothetical protein
MSDVFGEDYQPPDYLRQAYEQARRHKWYMTSRLITVNDPYAFDPCQRRLNSDPVCRVSPIES